MLCIEGEEYFAEPAESLWNRLADTAFLARCIPDLESVGRVEPQLLVCRVRPGFSFLRGRFELTIRIIEERAPRSVRMHVRGKGMGSAIEAESEFELADEGGGSPPLDGARTRVRWRVRVGARDGLLKPVGLDLVNAAARKVIADGWRGFRRELAAHRP